MANPGEGVGITPRVSAGTLAKWVRQVHNEAVQYVIILPVLMKRGAFRTVDGGGEIRWPFRAQMFDLVGEIDNAPRAHPRHMREKNANLPWAAYQMLNACTRRERSQNGGEAAIVKIFADMADQMRESFAQKFNGQIYGNGDSPTASIPEPVHGFETFCEDMAISADTDPVALTVTASYGGKSCAYDSFKPGATSADDEYGAWSARGINCNVHDDAGQNVDWADNAIEYIRLGLQKTCYGRAKGMRTDFVVLEQGSWTDLCNLLDDKERVQLSGSQMAAAYGFDPTDEIKIDGALVTWDHSIPQYDSHGTPKRIRGYGMNTSKIELLMLPMDGGVRPKGSIAAFYEEVDVHQRVLWELASYPQLKVESPRHVFCLKEYSAAA